jgi:hypothetical protein
LNAKSLALLIVSCLPLGGCLANASTPPSQDAIERAVREIEVLDQFGLRRGAVLIEHSGKKWWVATAGLSDMSREPKEFTAVRLEHLVRSSIALAALKNNPYCAEFRDLTITQMKKDDGFWVVYAVVRADNVRKGSSCTQSSPDKSIESEEMEDPLDKVKSEEISFP